MSDPAAPGPRPRNKVSRRVFLGRVVAAASLPAVGAAAYGAVELTSGSTAAPAKAKAKTKAKARKQYGQTPAEAPAHMARLTSGVTVPQAPWVLAENARPGSVGWVVTGLQTPGSLEGFASAVSAVAGDDVALFVSTRSKTFHVEAYRMGYYQGLGGRLVWTSDDVAGTVQPAPVFTPGINMVECHWAPSLVVSVADTWPPGAYLLKLVGDSGEQQYVPLCVRDDASTSAFVIQHSVTSWQAYNLWGGYDLYYGLTNGGFDIGMDVAGKDFDHRSRVVSFDRPYPKQWAQGAADFFGNEFPLIYHAESLGLDVTYWTDVDFHAAPQLLLQHRCLFSLGHDEYWSLPMRNGASQARDAGVNLAFLGANACYRQIRLESSPVGPNRRQVCYKSAAEDPLYGTDNALVTAPAWESPPTSWPESQLIGSMYQDVGADVDMVISDASCWLWAGTGVTDGQALPKVIHGEYDRFDPGLAGPRNVEIAAHSPVTNRGPGRYSDVTWYTASGGGGVLATGNAWWIYKLSNTTAFPNIIVPAAIPGVTDVLLRAMENVYATMGAGAASLTQASQPNWQEINGTAPVVRPAPTVSA